MRESEIVQENRLQVVEALQAAIEILSMEFSDTEGSGHEALTKCHKALSALDPGR